MTSIYHTDLVIEFVNTDNDSRMEYDTKTRKLVSYSRTHSILTCFQRLTRRPTRHPSLMFPPEIGGL